MKYRVHKFKRIEDNPETVRALLSFAGSTENSQTLSSYLNKIMIDKHLSAPQVYHRAELDRQIYNRLIQYNGSKRAAKRTLLQISIGIMATESEAIDLLSICGYAFTSEPEDRAYLFCIRQGLYTMYNVWEAIEILGRKAPGSTEIT